MKNETVLNIVLTLTGAVLGIIGTLVSTKINQSFQRGRERRKVAGRLWSMLEHIFLELEIRPALKSAGALTVNGMLGTDEAWRDLLPVEPPSMPKDFDSILEMVAEWEAENGNGEITKKMHYLDDQLEILHAIYARLSAQAKQGQEYISEQALGYYTMQLPGIRECVTEILHLVSPMRLNKAARIKKDWSYQVRRKWRTLFKRRSPSLSN